MRHPGPCLASLLTAATTVAVAACGSADGASPAPADDDRAISTPVAPASAAPDDDRAGSAPAPPDDDRAAHGPTTELSAPPPPAEPRALDEERVVEARLGHAPHDTPEGAPHVVAHLPRGLRTDEPLGVVVFLHGWSGCARALVGSGRVPCRRGGRPVPGWGLAERHAAADTNTVLVVPQLAWRARDGSPGRLGDDGMFRDMLAELLAGPLAEPLGGARTPGDLASLTLVAHSAGYESALAIVEHGGVDVTHVVLLDALYAGADPFAEWVAADDARRLVSLYTGRASTHRQSHQLARLATDALGEDAVATDPEASLADALATRRVVVDRSPHPHGAIPTRQLEEVLRALPLPAR